METNCQLNIPTRGIAIMESRGWKIISSNGKSALMEKKYPTRLVIEVIGEYLERYCR